MRKQHQSIGSVASEIKKALDSLEDSKNTFLLFAFNGTGKTRISSVFDQENFPEDNPPIDQIITLSYNALFEDLFRWDNPSNTMFFDDSYSPIIELIIEQSLENEITKNFQYFTKSKIDVNFDTSECEIYFSYATGDDSAEDRIKISRGEESLFIWSIFYTVLELALSVLETNEPENRETDKFNNLKYVVIDDPVSSIDDTKIVTLAVELLRLLNRNKNLKFIITTHHPLFYNIVHNHKKKKRSSFVLSKSELAFKLEGQDDSPFGYHLTLIKTIRNAIASDTVEKYHFNLFRVLLEKTANFLGYSNWRDCLPVKNRNEIERLNNLYSHGKLSDMESKQYPPEHKDIFVEAFNTFLEDYKWSKSLTN